MVYIYQNTVVFVYKYIYMERHLIKQSIYLQYIFISIESV